MLARLDPRHLEQIWFPLGEQTKEETRAEAERAGLAVARRAESQEACFLGGGDYRDFLERHGLNSREGRVVDESGRRRSARTTASGASPRASDEGSASSTGEPAYALGAIRRRTRSSSVPRPARPAEVTRPGASSPRSPGATRSSATARRPSRPTSRPTDDGFRLRLDEPAFGVAAGPDRRSLRR